MNIFQKKLIKNVIKVVLAIVLLFLLLNLLGVDSNDPCHYIICR